MTIDLFRLLALEECLERHGTGLAPELRRLPTGAGEQGTMPPAPVSPPEPGDRPVATILPFPVPRMRGGNGQR